MAARFELSELLEDAVDRVLNLEVGGLLDPIVVVSDEADRHFPHGMASPDLLLKGFAGSTAEKPELEFRHAPLETEQEAVVEFAGVVNPVRVDDQRLSQRAEVDQVVPIAIVPREARRFERQHTTSLAFADRGEETTEARTLLQAAPTLPLVLVNDDDTIESKGARTVGETVLELLALAVMANLVRT